MKKILLGLAAAIGLSCGVAYSAGLWPLLPTLGGVSSTLTQGGTTFTVPSGPGVLTGVETIPVDTNVAGGAGPATMLVNTLQAQQPVLSDFTTAGATTTIPNGNTVFVLDTGSSATVTVTMPAAPFVNQLQEIVCTGAGGSTSLTISPNTGQAIKAGPGAGACASGTVFRFFWSGPSSAVANTWIRF